MVGRVTVKVEGLKALDKALGELGKSAGKAVLRRTAKKALQPFDRAWRTKAPRLTGALEESGGVGTKLTRRQARLNKRREDRSSIEMYAGPNDPAALPNEIGTVDMAPQPFMRPAWDATKDETLDIVKNELGGEIEKTAKRQAARRAKG